MSFGLPKTAILKSPLESISYNSLKIKELREIL
jgi:hypothetical protein